MMRYDTKDPYPYYLLIRLRTIASVSSSDLKMSTFFKIPLVSKDDFFVDEIVFPSTSSSMTLLGLFPGDVFGDAEVTSNFRLKAVLHCCLIELRSLFVSSSHPFRIDTNSFLARLASSTFPVAISCSSF